MTPEEIINTYLKTKPYILYSKKKFSWERDSPYVAQYCPQYFNPEKFNWEKYSHIVPMFCPQHICPNKYNWGKYSYVIARLYPNKIDPKLYNWERYSSELIFHHPNHKYLKHCIWNTETTCTLKYIIENSNDSIWNKYKDQLNNLLDPTKRKTLLDEISKEIALEKILLLKKK